MHSNCDGSVGKGLGNLRNGVADHKEECPLEYKRI